MSYRPNPKWFDVREFVPPETYSARGEAAWELIDDRMLITIDALRATFGPIVINNWHVGGQLRYRGFRPFWTSIGATYSQHRCGRAIDFHAVNATPQEIHAYILAHPETFPLVTTLEAIEATPTWVHIDCRNNPEPGIRIVNP